MPENTLQARARKPMSRPMKVTSSHANWFLFLFVLGLIGSVGCKAAPFKKPDFTQLAFWKKANQSAELPPPPARHFDPAPLEESETVVAQNSDVEQSSDSTRDALAKQIQNEIDQTKQQLADAKSQLDSQPIRKPYSLDNSFAASQKNSSSQFKPLSNDGFKSAGIVDISKNIDQTRKALSTNNSLTQAQEDFQAAIANVSNDFSGMKKTATQSASKWKDFQLPTELNQVNDKVEKSLQAVDKSLYNASGKLNSIASSATGQVTSAFADASEQFKNQVQSKASKLNSDVKASTNDFVGSTTKSLSNISPLKAAQDNWRGNPMGLEPTGTRAVANNSQPVASKVGKLQPATNDMLRSSPKIASSPLNPVATNQPSNPEMEKMRNEMLEAKRQIELLQKQLADGQKPISKPDSATANATGSRDLNPLSRFESKSRYKQAAGLNSTSSNPVNRLRIASREQTGQGRSTLGNTSGFPSTGHGGFSPLGSGSGSEQMSSATSSASQASFVTTPGDPIGDSITKATTDVEIPKAILTGDGTYAPGSVNRLLR